MLRLRFWRCWYGAEPCFVACTGGLADASQVLLINVLFVVICSATYVVKGGIGTLVDGDCGYVENATVWLHVGINVLLTLLLSASNYTMQALCSPTRAEIDRAHTKGDWLDVGVPGMRNIWGRIAKRRAVMWWVLALSSVPIHLLYVSCSGAVGWINRS